MAKDLVSFKVDLEGTIEDFIRLQKDVREKVVLNGLDDTLKKSLKELKIDLKEILKNDIRPEKRKDQKDPKSVIQQEINIPKSKEALLKHFADIDIAEYNNQKDNADYYNFTRSKKLIFINGSSNKNSAARVELRIPISSGETVQSQFLKAKEFFKESVFAFPNKQGQQDLYLNVDPSISDHVKIKCSKYTGDDDFEEFGGMSPERRFETNKKIGKDYADWSLKQDYVENIQKSGVNISRIVEDVLDGKYDDARNYISSLKNNKSQISDELMAKIDQLDDNTITPPSPDGSKHKNFEAELRKQIAIWKNVNADKWIKSLIDKTAKVIKEFHKGSK